MDYLQALAVNLISMQSDEIPEQPWGTDSMGI
jgi:hypothetical protein